METKTGENGDVTVDTGHSLSMFTASDLPRSVRLCRGRISEGGNFKLTGDAWTADNGSSANLSITQNTTIDLNGIP